MKLESLYKTEKISIEKTYLGRIIIDKIDLDYYVFNSFSEDNLKLSPCKFYGGNLEEDTNICIAGHNYDNFLFFGRINELKYGDNIIIKDKDKTFIYKVFDKYEINNDDLSILKKTYKKELTLLTCNNLNKKRIIVKALLDEVK